MSNNFIGPPLWKSRFITHILLYYSGADTVMFERLKSGQEDLKTKTQDHLDVSFIQIEINFVKLNCSCKTVTIYSINSISRNFLAYKYVGNVFYRNLKCSRSSQIQLSCIVQIKSNT